MRITGGIYRGRELKSPATSITHPMGSREKLALFNAILPYLPEKRVLDAFAGSGALGLEALSRGAKNVVFCEKSPKVAQTIKQNIALLGAEGQTEVIIGAVEKLSPSEQFDIIIADPPYDHFNQDQLTQLSKLVAKQGIMVISHPANYRPNLPNFTLKTTKSYAAANISVFLNR